MLLMCTTVQQGHGRRLSSSGFPLQLHRSGTWLCSLGVRCCIGRGGGRVFIVACVVCVLLVVRYCGSVCPVTASSLMRATAACCPSNVVGVYNVTTGAWSTAQLSVARFYPTAASVGNLALFAGGQTGSALLCREGIYVCGFLLMSACCVFCACCSILRFWLPCDRFLSNSLHCSWVYF
jgi:hypothetical protein